jgi:hypothetical protein
VRLAAQLVGVAANAPDCRALPERARSDDAGHAH